MPTSLSTEGLAASIEGFTASVAGVSGVAADNLTSVAVVNVDTPALSSTGISNPAGFKTEPWASGPTSVAEGVNSCGGTCGGGDEVMEV